MLTNLPTVKEAILYESLKDGRVRCGLCERRCLIPPGESGFCQTRLNIEGRLYTLVYGDLSALESRPIEIKPFFHFHPGSSALTFSTWSCNFTCPWCQNWHLSKKAPNPKGARYIPPERVVATARECGDEGLCVSFQEPTLLFEYALEVFKQGKAQGLYGSFVSNGYLSLDALRMLKKAGMEAINIDIKGDKELYKGYLQGAKEEIIWRNARAAKEMGIHVEIIHLIVTGLNDQGDKIKRLIQKHLDNLGPETPLHFTRYFPAYHYHQPPTPKGIMEFAYTMAKEAGIYYPYLGNIPAYRYENTYCPSCGTLLIERIGYQIRKKWLRNKKCPHCHREIEVIV
ncbi:MAG: AmmeMemoRadiSam system radical SAM enzyme [Deltaproteobacteria bacterium]|nr:MAG: AmmeMemoRadiSam system radical SAM enzyme [Deltaproteobacteria bacterium]